MSETVVYVYRMLNRIACNKVSFVNISKKKDNTVLLADKCLKKDNKSNGFLNKETVTGIYICFTFVLRTTIIKVTYYYVFYFRLVDCSHARDKSIVNIDSSSLWDSHNRSRLLYILLSLWDSHDKSHLLLAHLAEIPHERLPSIGVRRPSSVNFSHLNLLLWNRITKWTETW